MNKTGLTYSPRQTALAAPRSAPPQWQPGLIPDEFSYNDVWRTLRKQKRTILLSAALAGGLALSLCLLVTPKFRSVALIEINRESTDALGLDTYNRTSAEESPDGLETTMVTQTEANILRGSALSQQVTQQLGLENRKEFSLKPGYFDRFAHALGFNSLALPRWLSWLSNLPEVDAEKQLPLANSPRRQDLIRKGFEKNLKVDSIPGTRLIQVQFLSPDPYVAANVVNTLINDYIDQHIRSRYSATAQTSDWLSRQLQDLKSQAESSQAKVNKLQDQVGILAADETRNVTVIRLDELNKQLVAAETNRILKEAAYRLAISGNPELISAAGSNLDSAGSGGENANRLALIQNLRAQQATLKSQYAQAQVKFGPSYPTVLQLQSQLADLDSSIQTEIQETRRSGKERLHGRGRFRTRNPHRLRSTETESHGDERQGRRLRSPQAPGPVR